MDNTRGAYLVLMEFSSSIGRAENANVEDANVSALSHHRNLISKNIADSPITINKAYSLQYYAVNGRFWVFDNR
jgi:hypothetical protein